jgi:hypothetical protein
MAAYVSDPECNRLQAMEEVYHFQGLCVCSPECGRARAVTENGLYVSERLEKSGELWAFEVNFAQCTAGDARAQGVGPGLHDARGGFDC